VEARPVSLLLPCWARCYAPPVTAIARVVRTSTMLPAVAFLVTALTACRVVTFWPRHTYLDTASGVWIALAVDLADGVFYRPVVGPDGYGATRYFPIYFVGHAALIKAIGDPFSAGYLMSAISVALIVAGVALILRARTPHTALALAAAAVVLAPQAVQRALLSVRPDALAAGLAVAGLAALQGRGRVAVVLGFALFGVSFGTKLTSVAGLAAGLLWLLVQGRRRDALLGTVTFTATVSLLLATTWFFSDGRFAEALGAGVGNTPRASILTAPLTMMRLARQVPETAVFMVLGAALGLVSLTRRQSADLPLLYWLTAMLLTLPIFVVPNTAANHLLEPAVASVLLAGVWAVRHPRVLSVQSAMLVAATLAASGALAWGLISADAEQRWGTPAEAAAFVGDRTRPILAENPAVAVAAGQRAYMLDAFLFQLMAARDPRWSALLQEQIRAHAFSAVVLERDPDTDRGRDWYQSSFFGAGFPDVMKGHYREAGRSRSRVIYLPRD
jgi:hypothetical protein